MLRTGRPAGTSLNMLVDVTKMGCSFQVRQDGQLNLTFAILAIFITIIISVDGNSGEVIICWWVWHNGLALLLAFAFGSKDRRDKEGCYFQLLVSIYEQSISADHYHLLSTVFCKLFGAECVSLVLCSSRAQKLLTNKRAVVGGHQGCGYNLPVTHAWKKTPLGSDYIEA